MASVRRIWALVLIAALLLPGFNALAEATSRELEAAAPESESFELSDAFGGQPWEKAHPKAYAPTEHVSKAGGLLSVTADPSTAEVNTSVTFVLVTTSEMKVAAMYAENGNEVKRWDSSYSTLSGDRRTWKLSYAFTKAGNRSMMFRVGTSDSTLNDIASVAVNIVEVSAPAVTSVSAARNPMVAGEQQTFTVRTPQTATYLRMYAENGTVAGTWTASGNSSVSGSERTWTLKQAINAEGSRTLTFKASANGKTFGTGRSVSFTVNPVPAVTSVTAAKNPMVAGEQQTFTVRTPSAAMYLRMYAENGTVAGTWTASGNSSVSGSERTWTLKQAINAEGSRTLTFKASADGKNFGTGRSVSFTVDSKLPTVISVSVALNPMVAGEQQTFTVRTPSTATYLRMYAENGAVAGTWMASGNSSVSGSERTWTLKQAINAAGSRTLTFKASADGKTYGEGRSVSFIVNAVPAVTNASVALNPMVAGEQQTFTVRTPSTATYLRMYAENGAVAGAWTASGNSSVSGSERTWTLKQVINSAGSRMLTFKASADGDTFGEGRSVSFTVDSKPPAVTSVSAAYNTMMAGEQQTFRVKTTLSVKYLRLFDESGTEIDTWAAGENSSVSGSERTWTLRKTINSAGNRTLTFKASADGNYFGAEESVSFTVDAHAVISVMVDEIQSSESNIYFTVLTSAAARYLRIFDEDNTIIRTMGIPYYAFSGEYAMWDSDRQARIWNVILGISDAGNRTLTFKASTNGEIFGDGKSVTYTVNCTVTSVSVALNPMNPGEHQTFTVETPAEAAYLRLYAEDGTSIATWSAKDNSSLSGSIRTWTVKQAINSAGSRTMTFKASRGRTSFGVGKSVTFTVNEPTASSVTVSSVAVASSTIKAGAGQTFTVETSAAAKYLRLQAENCAVICDWEASSNNGTVDGNTRIWEVSLNINSPGDRTLTFRASADGSAFSMGKSVSFTVIPPPDVLSVSVAENPIAYGEQQTITVETSAEAVALEMEDYYCGEYDLSSYHTWDAGSYSYLSGSKRIWNVSISTLHMSIGGESISTYRWEHTVTFAATNGYRVGRSKTVYFSVW